MSINLNF
jgi:DNA-directed RNA polymerase